MSKQPKIFDLETAIKIHLANERKYLSPLINTAIQNGGKIHIKTFETAPRNSDDLRRRIAIKKAEFKKNTDTFKKEPIRAEIDALERLLGMVVCFEKGEPLDGLAY